MLKQKIITGHCDIKHIDIALVILASVPWATIQTALFLRPEAKAISATSALMLSCRDAAWSHGSLAKLFHRSEPALKFQRRLFGPANLLRVRLVSVMCC